jgi:hypothetical protein
MKEATNEYAAEYEHGGSKWALNFFARDSEDAAAKIANLRATVQLVGQIASRVPCQSIPPQYVDASST